jgi:hypothetical protein
MEEKMTEQEIKDEMRLWALEVLVANAFSMLVALDEDPHSFFRLVKKQMIDGAKQRTFSGVDAATSDLYSAELEGAVTRLMDMVSSQIAIGLKSRKSSSEEPWS